MMLAKKTWINLVDQRSRKSHDDKKDKWPADRQFEPICSICSTSRRSVPIILRVDAGAAVRLCRAAIFVQLGASIDKFVILNRY